jgi:hypothetical protein
MAKTILILIAFMGVLSGLVGHWGQPRPGTLQGQGNQNVSTPQEGAIKVAIASVGKFLGPPTDHYRVGEQIPITITMTNTATSPVTVCISSDLYQNLPTLTRNGEVVPYMKWQSYERLNAQRSHTCKNENQPEPALLKPNIPTMADWFVLVDERISSGAEAWYDSLPPGKYELSIQRRFSCCDGPTVESNKISFEVVP